MFNKLITLLFLILIIFTTETVAQNRRYVTYRSMTINHTVVNVQAYLYDVVDVQPQFPGGDAEMMKFINKERKYPKSAYDSGIEGRVVCSFIVKPNGEISNAEVLRGVEESLNQEALRIIESMPKWEAGSINDINVPVYCILAIPFRK